MWNSVNNSALTPCLHPKHFNYNEFLSILITWHNIKGKLFGEIWSEQGQKPFLFNSFSCDTYCNVAKHDNVNKKVSIIMQDLWHIKHQFKESIVWFRVVIWKICVMHSRRHFVNKTTYFFDALIVESVCDMTKS